MSAELQMYQPAHASLSTRSTDKLAETALRASARFWFVVTIPGQLLFAFTVAAFYGLTAVRGDLHAWNRLMMSGHVPEDTAGNLVVAMHLLSAVIVIVAGAIQFVAKIRVRFPRFHRWTGRMYVLSAVTLTTAGLYMQWVRGSFGDESQRIGSAVNAVLIWICAYLAVRYAIRREFAMHRRWTLRLFVVVSAAWFFRAAFFLTLLLFQGPVGFDPNTFSGPLLTAMSFGQYLVPLFVLELYFRAHERPGALRRFAVAASLFILTLGTGAGVLAISGMVWVPQLKAAFDGRTSIARTLAVTLESKGIDAAVDQYRALKAASDGSWNFDEKELNTLGYQLLRGNDLEKAVRIFQLNAEAYPHSANTWDSLGEAYLRRGDAAHAISNYRKSLQLNPDNRNAVVALQKLRASSVATRVIDR